MSTPVIRIRDIAAHEGQEVEIRGWLYGKRSSGKLHFLQVRDGSATVQAVVFKKDVPEETFARADHVGQESSVIVRGTVRADARSPLGFELSVKEMEVVQGHAEWSRALEDLPVAAALAAQHGLALVGLAV